MNKDGPARRQRTTGLLALNGALLIALGGITFMPQAQAQSRARGSYTMVGGRANGATGGVVYIVDTVNEELVAVTLDPNQKLISGIGYRNLAADAAGRGSGR